MKTLWIYGDSFAEHSDYELQWYKQLLEFFNEEHQLQVHSLAGVANDWISTQILETVHLWLPEDKVIVIPTQANRQWWFEEHPHLSNINSMWGHPMAQQIEAENKPRVDAVGYYMNYLQRDSIDGLRVLQMLAWIEYLAQDVDLRIIPAFDLGVDLSHHCEGTLTDVCNAEFFDHHSQQRHYAKGVDSRVNHLSPDNHSWLAHTIAHAYAQGLPVDLTQGSRRGFIV